MTIYVCCETGVAWVVCAGVGGWIGRAGRRGFYRRIHREDRDRVQGDIVNLG